MTVGDSGADIRQTIKSFLRDNPPPEGIDEKVVFRILRILEDYQFNIDRSRPRNLIKKEIEGRS